MPTGFLGFVRTWGCCGEIKVDAGGLTGPGVSEGFLWIAEGGIWKEKTAEKVG